ncbi:MAG: carboxypeptidase regulatory-like domain-containing protein [Balneolaceae bacterium]|nr:MAG: carboxypeptidase regulatory-like domain-containing protein [Balneolaceae bacterium]
MSNIYLKRVVVFAVLLVGFAFQPTGIIKAQDHQPSIQFVELFNNLQQELPREYIHLHTDRNWYVFGDRIWFSAYVAAGSYHLPSGISSVLYIELIEPNGEMADRMAVELSSGRAAGSITFNNANPEEGTYRIRAYTAWALNFGESYVFEKDLYVITGEEEEVAVVSNGKSDLQFLPEGGHLIDGIPARLAFKAIGPEGLGVDVRGTLYDENDPGFRIEFQSEYLGMGVINDFLPTGEAAYYAEINGERYSLPDVRSSGTSMRIGQSETQYMVDIHTNRYTADTQLLLFAHVRGSVSYASLILIESGRGSVIIPKNQFPTGIVHFTLLNENGHPITERLAFNKNESDLMDAEISIDRDRISARSEVNLDLSVRDSEGSSSAAKASISVFDDGITEFDQYSANIQSRFYLESELKGHIENPGIYFSDNDKADQYLDLLMLTQGWRAYNMEEIADLEVLNIFALPELGFTISGSIKSAVRGRPLEDATVIFSIGSGHEDVDLITTDETGRFMLTDLQINGSELITIRANDASGSSRVRIEVDPQFENLPMFEGIIPQRTFEQMVSDVTIYESMAQIGERAEQVHVDVERFVDAQMFGELEEIVVTADREETADQFERDLRIGSRPGQRIDFDENEVMASIPLLQAINQMAGVSADPVQGLSIKTGFTNLTVLPAPLIIVDDIEMNFEYIRNLSTSDIQTINVFRRSSELGFFGARGAGGVLVIRTREGTGVPGREPQGLITAFVQGFQPPSEFYSPRYGITVPRDFEQPDNRITLHWDGEIDISESGETVRFWSGDVPSTYRVVLEGITDNGIPFVTSNRLEVTE